MMPSATRGQLQLLSAAAIVMGSVHVPVLSFVSMAQGVQWKNAGAAVTITFQNVKITRLRDNKSVTINGAQTYTNVSGGLLANLPILNSITHRIHSSNLSLSFNDGTQRNWQVDKQRVFTYNNGAVITTTGLHTEGIQQV
jgi:hypothetical protein